MLKAVRPHLTYANVMATLAVFLVVGGAGAYAATHLKKNSVTSKTIKDRNVKTQDLADASVASQKLADDAVTTGKIADSAVTSNKIADSAVTSSKVADDSLVGDDVSENSLRFGCTDPTGNVETHQMPGGGFCAYFVGNGANGKSWSGAANFCSVNIPDATLPTPAQIAQLATTIPSPDPFASGAFWTSSVAAGGVGTSAAWVANVSGGVITSFTSLGISATSITDLACVYEPASKNG